MAGDGSSALLVLGFESSDHPVAEAMSRALALCLEHGGVVAERRESGGEGAARTGGDAGGDAVGSWRSAFLGAPYVRDTLIAPLV
jgi:alkyldihydroxyacetonephosphate synthase